MEPIHDLNQDGPDVTGKKIVLEISLEFIDCRCRVSHREKNREMITGQRMVGFYFDVRKENQNS